MLPSAFHTAAFTLSLMKSTAPSAMPAFTPPECLLRAEKIRFAHSEAPPLHGAVGVDTQHL